MKTCSKCGAPMADDDVICISCGARAEKNTSTPAPVQPAPQPTQQPYQQPYQSGYQQQSTESPSLATAAIICAILIPIVGLILGFVGKKKYQSEVLIKRCNIAVIIAIVMMVISFIAYL